MEKQEQDATYHEPKPLYHIIKEMGITDTQKIERDNQLFAEKIIKNLTLMETLDSMYTDKVIPFITTMDEYYRQERSIYLRIKKSTPLQHLNIKHIEERLSNVLEILDGFESEYEELSQSLESTIYCLDIEELSNHECQINDGLQRLFESIYEDIYELSLNYERLIERISHI